MEAYGINRESLKTIDMETFDVGLWHHRNFGCISALRVSILGGALQDLFDLKSGSLSNM